MAVHEKEDNPFRFHKTVRKFRLEMGLSQAELAELSGVGLRNLAKIESGENPNPTIATLASIANELEVGVDDLVGLLATKRNPIDFGKKAR